MNDMLNVLKKHLDQYCKEREGVISALKPLEDQKKNLDEKIETIERLISLEGDTNAGEKNDPHNKIKIDSETSIEALPLNGKTGQEGYKELINKDLKNKTFKEKDIRELANKKGLRINNKFISGSYSRALLNRLIDQGDLKRIKKGVFGTVDP